MVLIGDLLLFWLLSDGMVLLWIPSDGPLSSFATALDEDGDADFAKEHWRLRTMSRASSSEIYDMAWSPSADALVIGGTDFVARIINANDGECGQTFSIRGCQSMGRRLTSPFSLL
jgi:WD40 repeat protein